MKIIKKTLFILMTTVMTLSGAVANSDGDKEENSKKLKSKKYYQVVFIWVKDPEKFQKYGQLMGPIVSKYGGAGERIITPVSSFYGGKTGKNMEPPHMVNIVYYDSKESYKSFSNDPEFKKIVHLRDESIEMAGISGEVLGGDLTPGEVAQRLYMIEFAYYNDNGKGFRQYEKASKGYYDKYELRNERILKPDEVFGNIEMPDQVTIKYLSNENNRSAMESDKDHSNIEEMYNASIRDLIWIEGKAAFVNMD